MRGLFDARLPQKPVTNIFAILIRLFFSRFFDTESLSPQGEPEANVTQTLGILATPGAFAVLLFLPLNVLDWNLVAVRCLFLSFSMIVMGFIVVFEWDALFLDRRDYQILLPLPVPLWKLFAAKAIALSLFLGLFLTDVNFFATLFWPAIEESNDIFGVTAAHLLVVVASGLFAALAAASVQGLLLTIFPTRVFRPVSIALQTVLMAVLVMLLFLSPLMAGGLQALIRDHSPFVHYFPAFWFAGFYERLRPAVRSPLLRSLSALAIRALGYAAALFVLTHLPGYRRHARKMVETPPANPSGPGRLRTTLNAAIDSLLLKDPVQQAIFHFIGQTIGRSLKHRLFLATYAGFGAALAIMSFGPDHHGLLRLPLTLSFVLVSGFRAAFNFPAELGANWTFQIGDTNHTRACLTAVRKWIVACGVAPLFLMLVPVEFVFFSWPAALFHLFYGVTLSVMLVEAMFFGFQKIPFTCAYFPGKINLVFLSVMYVFGFSLYSRFMASLEEWMIQERMAAVAFFSTAACAELLLAHWRNRQVDAETGLDYQDAGDPAVLTLGLTPQ